MIAFILAGSTFLSLAMGFTGLPRNLAIWIQNLELSPYVLIFVLMIFYIILGMFLDGISAVVLTMAIIEPMIRQAGFDMIWFGIFLVIVVEMAQITPPVGFNLLYSTLLCSTCLLYTSPSPRDGLLSRMPSSA